MTMLRQIIEINAWNNIGAIETLRYTVAPDIITSESDVPSSTYIEGRIIDAGLLKYAMFNAGKTSGASTYSFGEVILGNEDKSLDALRNYSFDGRTLRLLEGPVDGAYPADYTQVYIVTIAAPPVFAWDQVSFSIRGYQADLNVPVPAGTFLGNNVAPAGVGGDSNLAGKPKPFLLGRCPNISPICCNTSKLIYAVSPATGIAATYMGSAFAVYDSGAELIFGGTYSSQADMEANAPSPGTYRVWEQGGYFRMGSSAAGMVTCDAASYGRSVTAKVGNLIADLLTLQGVSYDAASILALNSTFTSEVGIFANGDTVSAVLDQLCSACGAYWYFSSLGTLVVGQLVDPATLAADYSLSTQGTAIFSAEVQKSQDTNGGIPAHIVTLLRSKNYTVQASVAGVVPEDRKAWLKEQWRKTQVIDSAVKTAHPLSEEMQIETTLTQDNLTEATRRAGLYSVQRDIAILELSLDAFGSTANLRPGLCVSLDLVDASLPTTIHRFGYLNKKMLLVGFTVNRVSARINATFWG